MRLIDKSKKSNIKCEHCKNLVRPCGNVYDKCRCLIDGTPKHYWNRCKQFVWREDKHYVGELRSHHDSLCDQTEEGDHESL